MVGGFSLVVIIIIESCFETQILSAALVKRANNDGNNKFGVGCTRSAGCTINKSSLNMLIVGDWGGMEVWPYKSAQQIDVAKAMEKVAEKSKTDMVLSLGDNFYHTGVKNLEDSRFKDTFEEVYDAQSLQVPWFIMAGNHDHFGNLSAQMAYTNVSNRWIYPNKYYSIQINVNNEFKLEIIVIDTIDLCGNTNDKWYYHLFSKLNQTKILPEERDRQWKWIEDRIKSSTANYLFVNGHYPIWSVGKHGPTKCLVDRLEPLLAANKVNLYLCGHDHQLQHIQTTTNGFTVNHILSGLGGATDTEFKFKDAIPTGSLKYLYPPDVVNFFKKYLGIGVGGFNEIILKKEKGTALFYDHEAKANYKFEFKPRK